MKPIASLATLVVLSLNPLFAQAVWVQHGPGPNTLGQVENITDREVVGAIPALAVHPTDAGTIYVGAVNGGIWKTVNATAASPRWVEQLGLNRSLSIGAIAFDPTDSTSQTLLAGSGGFSSFGLPGDHVGAWRTTDGGTTWTPLGQGVLAGLNITGVAARGPILLLSVSNANSVAGLGVWRSKDTGVTWTRVSGAPGSGLPFGVSFDLASDPANQARLFSGEINGIFRSTDSGATWKKVSDALIEARLSGATSNVKIAVGSANSIYVAIVNSGVLDGLFRSGDGGATWQPLDLPITIESGEAIGIHPGRQGGIHLSMTADRTDSNIVYIGGDRQPFLNEFTTGKCPCFPNSLGANDYSGRLFRVDASKAAGRQATPITHVNTGAHSAPHADSRRMAVDAHGDLIEADDGGIYRRTSPRTNTGDWFSVIGDLAITEVHSVAWDANAKVAIAGAQDTGVPEQAIHGNARWRSVETADGGDVAVDSTGTPGLSIRYFSSQGLGGFSRQTYDASNTMISQVALDMTPLNGGDKVEPAFYTPIAINNAVSTRLVIGANNAIYESFDQGDTVTDIANLTVNNDAARPIAYGAAGNADILYVGVDDQVFIRTAAPPSPLLVSVAYPGRHTSRRVAGIAVHRSKPKVAIVVDRANVYRTADAGATWTDITGNLQTLFPGQLFSVAFSTSNSDGSVIVGGNNGAFIARGPSFTSWNAVGAGLPRAPVFDLAYESADDVLVAGLLGRGTWAVSLAEPAPPPVSANR
jgi:hypothetical protein